MAIPYARILAAFCWWAQADKHCRVAEPDIPSDGIAAHRTFTDDARLDTNSSKAENRLP